MRIPAVAKGEAQRAPARRSVTESTSIPAHLLCLYLGLEAAGGSFSLSGVVLTPTSVGLQLAPLTPVPASALSSAVAREIGQAPGLPPHGRLGHLLLLRPLTANTEAPVLIPSVCSSWASSCKHLGPVAGRSSLTGVTPFLHLHTEG